MNLAPRRGVSGRRGQALKCVRVCSGQDRLQGQVDALELLGQKQQCARMVALEHEGFAQIGDGGVDRHSRTFVDQRREDGS